MNPTVISIYGPPGSGKTSFALTWPKKIRIFDFDLGADRGWQFDELIQTGQIIHSYNPLPSRSMTEGFEKLHGFIQAWSEFTKQFTQAVQDNTVKTIILDTGTNLWKLCCDAYLEELQDQSSREGKPLRKQLIQVEYGRPNTRMKLLFDTAKSYQKDLIVVHHETEEYVPVTVGGKPLLDENGQPKSAPTGNKIPDGFKYVTGMAGWSIKTSQRRSEINGTLKTVVVAKIEKSAKGLTLIGEEIIMPTYEKLEALVKILGGVPVLG